MDVPAIRIAMCQLNTIVGDIEGNAARILEAMAQARSAGADIAVFPELAVTGYPPEDLLLKPKFVADNIDAMNHIAEATGAAGSTTCVAIFGFVDRDTELRNAAAICHSGMLVGRYYKQVLPNYGPFDEQRYFSCGEQPSTLYSIAGVKVGVTVCEDAWVANGPIAQQANGGAELVININASPFYAGRRSEREKMLASRAREAGVPIVYVNQVGGQDELVFDGGSMVLDASGELIASAVQFSEETLIVDIEVAHRATSGEFAVLPVKSNKARKSEIAEPLQCEPMDANAEIYSALVLGTADYIKKNGFTDVVIGLSGGIDSSLVASVAVDAIGAAHVHGVMMPSRYSSESSTGDARALAENLGIDVQEIPIEPAHHAIQQMLKDAVNGDLENLTDENLQSRIRGVTLMALSNQFGWLVLTTGNKSELAVGYSTLYGDTAGGFAVIKDVAKTQVYELCYWRNESGGREIIPTSVLTKAPSAELRPGQVDTDSLPPYEMLDPILEAYVENDETASEIESRGYDMALVRRVIRMVDMAEYKRRQSPLGVRVTPKAFGKDRRVPITNQYPG